ncbi:MAG: DUF58 domain-containing protein [Thermaceae bacterium]|nr:DUF58 domain-containing protein [Thermaceae bacterium]
MLFRRPKVSRITVSLPPPGPPSPDLPAELLRKLEFKVLKRLDGLLFGDYTGFFYGPSLDLAEVREYQPGDEVRRIDWNVTARSGGRIHVRQYREEREVTAWLVLDFTASMNFGTRRALKREVALEFAATASAIIARHGDKVGAVGFSEQGLRIIPPGSGRKQTLRILHALQGVGLEPRRPQPPSQDDLFRALEQVSKRLKRRALVFVVSDFLSPEGSEPPTWALGLRRLAYKHDVVAVWVSDPAERELPKAGELRLRDPESGEELWVDTSDPHVRAAYARLVEQRGVALARDLRAARVDLLPLSTAQDIVEPIFKFTLRRRGHR